MSKFSKYYVLRYLIFGMPKYYSKIRFVITAIYLVFYIIFSSYKILYNQSDFWAYKVILLLSIASAIFLIIYYFLNRRNYTKSILKDTQPYLSIMLNIFKIFFISSNIFVVISWNSTSLPTFYNIVALVFALIYLTFIIINILINVIKILTRVVNFKKYIPLLKNKELINYIANDIKDSIDNQNS